VFGPLLRRDVLKYSDRTTLSVLASLTDNQKLIGVLTAQYGDYGLPPAQSSFYMHALLANHYMDGGAYPIGGGASIARTVIPVIEAAGGAVLFLAEVKRVIVEHNTAVGVEMADGKNIHASRIISDAGIRTTFGSLVPADVAEKHGFPDMLKRLEPSCAHIGMYVGINESPKALNLARCNYWVFPPEYDHDRLRKEYVGFDSRIPVAYISFPAAKDPQWQKTHPNLTTVEVIIIVPFEWFAKWKHTDWKKRGEEYEAMKKAVSDQLLEILYRVEPQLRGKVDYMEISTPLSTKKFMNHAHGEIYGVAHTPKRFRQRFLKPWTPVKNLFLTGQDVMIASIAGALMGGVLTASAILKRDVLGHIKRIIK
jgi:all-trans-retinol 13,14-reductase